MLARVVTSIKLEELHFCRENKVRYRKHLTAGMLVSTALCLAGTAYGVVWMCHAGTIANGITAMIWIWE